MNIFLLKKYYEKNNLPDTELRQAIDLIMELNENIDYDIDAINEDMLDGLIVYLTRTNQNTIESFCTMMRYFRLLDRKDLFIHLTKYTGMVGVIDNIIKRLKKKHGAAITKKIVGDYRAPNLGVNPKRLPDYLKELMDRLNKNLSKTEVRNVLTGNNHDVPVEAMLPEKVEYENAKTLEEYLKGRHQRKVKELEEYLKNDEIWFEQIITKEVIDLVKGNQEILSAKLKNDKLYVTKIPYDTVNFIGATDDMQKRYFACHCPFVREAIKEGREDISPEFCYCSAGFAKYPFEVIFDKKLKVKVLESALSGSNICRFEIDLKNIDYKK